MKCRHIKAWERSKRRAKKIISDFTCLNALSEILKKFTCLNALSDMASFIGLSLWRFSLISENSLANTFYEKFLFYLMVMRSFLDCYHARELCLLMKDFDWIKHLNSSSHVDFWENDRDFHEQIFRKDGRWKFARISRGSSDGNRKFCANFDLSRDLRKTVVRVDAYSQLCKNMLGLTSQHSTELTSLIVSHRSQQINMTLLSRIIT